MTLITWILEWSDSGYLEFNPKHLICHQKHQAHQQSLHKSQHRPNLWSESEQLWVMNSTCRLHPTMSQDVCCERSLWDSETFPPRLGNILKIWSPFFAVNLLPEGLLEPAGLKAHLFWLEGYDAGEMNTMICMASQVNRSWITWHWSMKNIRKEEEKK